MSHKKRVFCKEVTSRGKTMLPQNFVMVHKERAIYHDNSCSARVAFTRQTVDR